MDEEKTHHRFYYRFTDSNSIKKTKQKTKLNSSFAVWEAVSRWDDFGETAVSTQLK